MNLRDAERCLGYEVRGPGRTRSSGGRTSHPVTVYWLGVSKSDHAKGRRIEATVGGTVNLR